MLYEERIWKQYKNRRPYCFGTLLFLFASLQFQPGYKLTNMKSEKSKRVNINIQ